MLKMIRDLTNHLGVMVATGLGNLLLYYILFSGKYIPRWLSVWGIIGNILILLASFLILFQLVDVISTAYIAYNHTLSNTGISFCDLVNIQRIEFGVYKPKQSEIKKRT